MGMKWAGISRTGKEFSCDDFAIAAVRDLVLAELLRAAVPNNGGDLTTVFEGYKSLTHSESTPAPLNVPPNTTIF